MLGLAAKQEAQQHGAEEEHKAPAPPVEGRKRKKGQKLFLPLTFISEPASELSGQEFEAGLRAATAPAPPPTSWAGPQHEEAFMPGQANLAAHAALSAAAPMVYPPLPPGGVPLRHGCPSPPLPPLTTLEASGALRGPEGAAGERGAGEEGGSLLRGPLTEEEVDTVLARLRITPPLPLGPLQASKASRGRLRSGRAKGTGRKGGQEAGQAACQPLPQCGAPLVPLAHTAPPATGTAAPPCPPPPPPSPPPSRHTPP
ncbi:hypothetical protein V8C86DRAFT_513785 [Haematococcus lacustris]